MGLADKILESLIVEKGPDGGHLSKMLFGERDLELRFVNKSNASKLEKALKKAGIKYKSTFINLSKSKYNGHFAIGFKMKVEDEVDDILHDELEISNVNPLAYDDDWNSAKL